MAHKLASEPFLEYAKPRAQTDFFIDFPNYILFPPQDGGPVSNRKAQCLGPRVCTLLAFS